jgi:hypothetical protein
MLEAAAGEGAGLETLSSVRDPFHRESLKRLPKSQGSPRHSINVGNVGDSVEQVVG